MTAEIIIPSTPVLTAMDRCDRCPAQAWVGVMVTVADPNALRFCAHHFAKHEEALRAQADFIVDERYRLPGWLPDLPADDTEPAPA